MQLNIMGDHLFHKKDPQKRHKYGYSEGQDIGNRRAQRVSFKTYVKQLEEDLLEIELQQELEEQAKEDQLLLDGTDADDADEADDMT